MRAFVAAALVCCLAESVSAQEAVEATPVEPRRLELRLEDAVRLATTNNTTLRARYYDHLVERSLIESAAAAFDPLVFAELSYGKSEVVFPQIFPTGNVGPDGQPEFFQTIVTDRTDTARLDAGLRGRLTSGATWELATNSTYAFREGGGLVNPSYNTSTSLSFAQPVLRSAFEQYNLAPVRQARLAEGQARERFRGDMVDTSLAVHRAYWELVFARGDLEVKRESLEVARRLLEINRVKVRTGVFAPIEIAAAESGVSDRVTDVIIAEAALATAADDLKRLILPFERRADWDLEIVPLDPADDRVFAVPALDQAIDASLGERPDLQQARLGLRSREISVATADNESLPKLDLSGSLRFTGLSNNPDDSFADSFGDDGAFSWNLGVAFEVPIGNRAARARVAQRRLERDRAILEYRDLRVGAARAVRSAWRQVKTAEQTIVSRKRAEELKREELRNEEIKFENKVSTNFQVLQVLEDLSLRRSELLRARTNYRIALAELASSMGSSLSILAWPARSP